MKTLNLFILTIGLIVLASCKGAKVVGLADKVAIAPVISYDGSSGTHGQAGNSMTVTPSVLLSVDAAITNCVSSPALPAGLSLDSSTCVLSGVPTVALSSTVYTITATNSAGASTAYVSLIVDAAAPSLSYVGLSGSAAVGSASTFTPTILSGNGSAISSCTISPSLSTGLSIHNTTCVISGTPSATEMATVYTVTATNTDGSANANFTITVNAGVPVISYAGATGTGGVISTPLSVTPTTLTQNGAAVTSCTISPALSAGLSIDNTTCVISGTPSASASLTSYTVTATNSAGSSTGSVSLEISASLAAPTLSYSGATGLTGSINASRTISPTTLATNGASITSCTISPALPSGLSLHNTTCVISGTPSVASASTSYTVTATNSVGSTTDTFNLSVSALAPTLSYAAATGTTGSFGSAMTVTPTSLNSNGSSITSCTISPALSAGLSLHNTTCVISGTPSAAAASTSYIVTATNGIGSANATVSLVISALAPSLSYSGSSGTSATINSATTVTPTTLNANGASITSCTVSPALPSWASLHNTTCVISGTPDAALSSTTYAITATNSAGSISANVSLSAAAFSCPTNYIPVPYNTALDTTANFCVMKYEARCVGSACPATSASTNAVATSQASDGPWVYMTHAEAMAACAALGTGYGLITNAEWMTIAHNIEQVDVNWSTGVKGTGTLAMGHTDNSSTTLASAADNDPYYGTGNDSSNGWDQKRTFTLASGEVIWDLSGNAYEWVDWTVIQANKASTSTPTNAWREFTALTTKISESDYMSPKTWRPFYSTLNSSSRMGMYYSGTSGNVARRGGSYNTNYTAAQNGGLYALTLNSTSTGAANLSHGFRCTYHP